MKIAIITDIHEDFVMLSKALEVLKKAGYDRLVCLGDITGFSTQHYDHHPDANACIDLLREEADIVVPGNHDLYTSGRLSSWQLESNLPSNWYGLSLSEKKALTNNTFWLYESEIIPKLFPENIQFINGLKEYQTLDTGKGKVLFSHFVKPDLAGTGTWMPHRIGQLRPHFRFMEENNCKLAFMGHFHPDNITIAGRFFRNADGSKPICIGRNPSIILCQALAGKKNSVTCLIFDSDTEKIIPYILG